MKIIPLSTTFLSIYLSFFLLGCSDEEESRQSGIEENSDAIEPFCSPGDEQECFCTNGKEGTQVCGSGGKKWKDCRCKKNNTSDDDDDSAGNSDGDADADADSDSDADSDTDSDVDSDANTDNDKETCSYTCRIEYMCQYVYQGSIHEEMSCENDLVCCEDGAAAGTTNTEVDTEEIDPGECDTTGNGEWDPAWAAMECQVLTLVNEIRAKGYECKTKSFAPTTPLTMEPHLREAARLHSKDMGERNFFAHEAPAPAPNGVTVPERTSAAGYTNPMVGENIAAGQTTPKQVMNGWMASDGHCQNIMSPNYVEIGVGYAFVAGGGFTAMRHYWTQDFGGKSWSWF
jgi:uncharacterized protein YkwD